MRNIIALSALVVLGSLAVAQQQTPPDAVTFGKGEAGNTNPGRANFDFEAAKWISGDSSTVRGRFNFKFEAPDRTKNFGLELRPVMHMSVDGNSAIFEGAGKLLKRGQNGQPIVVNGRVWVKVWDNKRPNQQVGGAIVPDKISVRFNVEGSELPPREWMGAVRRGDIVVRVGPPAGGTTGGSTGGTTGGGV